MLQLIVADCSAAFSLRWICRASKLLEAHRMYTVNANEALIPALGFGTYGMDRADMLRMVPLALKAGFRHFDTAQLYGNEAEVGECIADSGVARADIRHDVGFGT
jgi:Aldo/keto reductase family